MQPFLMNTWLGIKGMWALLKSNGDDDDGVSAFWITIGTMVTMLVVFFIFRKTFMKYFRKLTPKGKTRIKKVYVPNFRRRK